MIAYQLHCHLFPAPMTQLGSSNNIINVLPKKFLHLSFHAWQPWLRFSHSCCSCSTTFALVYLLLIDNSLVHISQTVEGMDSFSWCASSGCSWGPWHTLNDGWLFHGVTHRTVACRHKLGHSPLTSCDQLRISIDVISGIPPCWPNWLSYAVKATMLWWLYRKL